MHDLIGKTPHFCEGGGCFKLICKKKRAYNTVTSTNAMRCLRKKKKKGFCTRDSSKT
jgi:hypothetical protein